jgi:MarR family 2-MHQ and catechol resistance regulon transcriptional repressor
MKSRATNSELLISLPFEESLLRLRSFLWQQQEIIRARYSLKPDEFNIILHLLNNKNQRMRDLGDKFQIKLSTLTSIVDKIERSKYVRRENSTKDRRVIYLELTDKGKRLCDAYYAYLREISTFMQEKLDENQLRVFIEGTKKLEESVQMTKSM